MFFDVFVVFFCQVKHFSKYGLLDDSDDDEDMVQAPSAGNKNLLPQQLPLKLPPATQQQATVGFYINISCIATVDSSFIMKTVSCVGSVFHLFCDFF